MHLLPPGIEVFERGWLSANNVFHFGENDVSLVDSGYCAHATNIAEDVIYMVKADVVKHHPERLN